jgi:hypothetical protein
VQVSKVSIFTLCGLAEEPIGGRMRLIDRFARKNLRPIRLSGRFITAPYQRRAADSLTGNPQFVRDSQCQ